MQRNDENCLMRKAINFSSMILERGQPMLLPGLGSPIVGRRCVEVHDELNCGEMHHHSTPLGSHSRPILPCPPRFTPLTFKEGADPAPGCHPSLAGVLPQCRFQEEDRDPTGEEEDEVGDEEGT